ncbi:MAG: hypothetical protein ACOYKZ_06360, partial [Chlamydiia bacterium]
MAKSRVQRPTIKSPRKRSDPKPLSAEAKGLALLLVSILGLMALGSFRLEHEESNWLGLLGYRWALGMHFLLGYGSYLLYGYLMWNAWRLLHKKDQALGSLQHMAFGIGLCSFCFLLNILSESWPSLAKEMRELSWSTPVHSPIRGVPSTLRAALGGQPTYLFLKDLPYLNLLRVLSPIGCTVVFGLLLSTAMILLWEIRPTDLFLALRDRWRLLREQRMAMLLAEPLLVDEERPMGTVSKPQPSQDGGL